MEPYRLRRAHGPSSADLTHNRGMLHRPVVVAAIVLLAAACERADGPADPSVGSTPTDEPVTVVAAGDIATDEAGDSATSDLVAELDPAWVLTLGDNVYPDGTAEEFARYYEPTWGRFKAITRPAPGNHEWHTDGAAGYTSYFGAAFPVRELVPYGELVPGWDIYQVDTSEGLNKQVAALDDLLTENPDACEIVYGHHPRFSSGGHGDQPTMQRLWGALVRHGVELYLAGHDHDYERFEPMDARGRPTTGGTRQVVVGTGGASTRPFADGSGDGSSVRISGEDHWGVLELELGAGSYGARFLRATGGKGTVADAFAGSCG